MRERLSLDAEMSKSQNSDLSLDQFRTVPAPAVNLIIMMPPAHMCYITFSFLLVCCLVETRLSPPRVQAVLRYAGDELERRYGNNLSAQAMLLLQCGDRSSAELRRNLTRVREELFRDGVNWGRVVTMMELGGALSAEVARTGRVGQVDDIARWLEESLDSPPLQGWIEDIGGWVGGFLPFLVFVSHKPNSI